MPTCSPPLPAAGWASGTYYKAESQLKEALPATWDGQLRTTLDRLQPAHFPREQQARWAWVLQGGHSQGPAAQYGGREAAAHGGSGGVQQPADAPPTAIALSSSELQDEWAGLSAGCLNTAVPAPGLVGARQLVGAGRS